MHNEISRRTFLGLSVLGASTLLVPHCAYADESISSSTIDRWMPSIPVSDNETIRLQNETALRYWRHAVEQALKDSEPIVILNASDNTIVPFSYYSPTCTKVVGYWPNSCTLGFCIYYDTEGSTITNVYGGTSFSTNGGALVEHLNLTYSLADKRRTICASFTTKVTWQSGIPALESTEIITTYAEFYYNGNCWASQ